MAKTKRKAGRSGAPSAPSNSDFEVDQTSQSEIITSQETADGASDGNEFISEARTAPRQKLEVAAVVQFRESSTDSWKEVVDIAVVSKNGAGITLSRPCTVGRIVSLVMKMPAELRAYDHFTPAYPVLGLVQNCTPILRDGSTAYHVGVAFFGKQIPESYRRDHSQCYRIAGRRPDGLWAVTEAGDHHTRRHARFWRKIEVSVAVRDEERRSIRRQKLTTREVSCGGMSVWGPLEAAVGDRVKVICADPEFFSMATVRNRTENPRDESRSLIHIEFDKHEFPIDKVPAVQPAASAALDDNEEAAPDELSETAL